MDKSILVVCPKYGVDCNITVKYIETTAYEDSERRFRKGRPSCSLVKRGYQCDGDCSVLNSLPDNI